MRTHARIGLHRSSKVYQPNKVMIWTDTFANNRQSSIFNTTLGENNARLAELNRQDIRVIIGNPPYSVGQDNANDDNQNEHYEELDERIAATYAARTEATLKNSLYDSYIRAYRWASDRIGEKGIIGFVTNAGWIDSNSADGMRKCLAEEFSAIYVYHLKGNARTQGEQRRKEKDNVFGEGSRAPVAIVFLVKNPEATEHGKIYFHAVGDYLTRDEKLAELKRNVSIAHTQVNEIVPDAHGDWLNQRDDSFSKFIRIGGKNINESNVFIDYSNGVKTNRDAWLYNSSPLTLQQSVFLLISSYRKASNELKKNHDISTTVKILSSNEISWSPGLLAKLKKDKSIDDLNNNLIRYSLYRPFFGQFLYYDTKALVERPGRWNNFFPSDGSKNLAICSSGVDNRVICVNQNAKDAGQIALTVTLGVRYFLCKRQLWVKGCLT